MSEPVVIKQSPVVIIKNLVILQLFITVAYFVAAVLANYGELYQEFTFSQVISYEIAKFSFIIAAELFLVVFIFLRWFFKTYAVYPEMLVIERGILLKRRRVVPLARPLSLSSHYGPLAKIFKYGTIIIGDQKIVKPIILTHVPEPAAALTRLAEQNLRETVDMKNEGVVDVEELIKRREHEGLEFKASLRWDTYEKRINKTLEKSVLKTVAAFLNSEGGRLVLGVDDKGAILGLAEDYSTLHRPGSDGFENHFTNIFRDSIGPELRRFVKLSFHDVDKKEVCLVRVFPSSRPAYLKLENDEAFYVRTGNSTTALQISEVAAYIKSRWKEHYD